ncbi:MAG: HAMP domain-containing sensor histidine kinase [Candidatus Izemoplasmatales bacterium]|jgi:signal transduction histidine kinase
MKKISTKIIGTLLLVFFFVSMIVRIVLVFVEETTIPELIGTGGFFLAMISMGFCSLMLFAIGVDFILVRRIKKMNTAILDIEKGKYEIYVETKGQDEISTLAKNINLMAKELQANEYLNKDFARNVSHEFKTPLSSIKGYAELIELGGLTAAEVTEYSEIIIHEIDRLAKLSHDLLQISLLDSVGIIKKEDTFAIDEQIRNVLQLTQLEWEGKNIEFDLDLEEITTQGNKELTFQIWQNLIDNAIKFTPENGKIVIFLHEQNGICFQITDNGIGISEDNQKQIFNQFFLTDKSRNKSGTGLGLSITKKIVEKLGGTITFESKLDVGTTFSVVLPEKNQA